MSHKELLNSTSRSAMVLGMTNTDQVGFWQAMAPTTVARRPEPEVLPDSGSGGDDGGGDDGGDRDPETGLTADEAAAFDAMRTGDEPPASGTDDPADDEHDGDGFDDDGTNPADPAPAAAIRTPKTAAELAAEAQTGKKPKNVSWGKHQREVREANERVRVAEERAQKAILDNAKLGERVAIINEALQARAAAPVEQPDPDAPPANPFDEEDIDPVEDYAGSVQQERRRNRFAYEATQQTRQQVTESSADSELRDTFVRDFTATAAKPEYAYLPAAYQHLKDMRLTQIFLSEFDKDPNDENEVFTQQEIERAVQLFNGEEKWLVGNAIKAKKSPAMAILKQAKLYGFKPPEPAARQPVPPVVPTVPARRTAAPAAPAAPSAAAELEQLRVAQQDGRSLSDGGGAPPQGLSVEMLLALGDEEFAEMVDGMSPHQLNALMGRGPG